MPRRSIAEFLMLKPDDNKGKIAMIKGEALVWRSKVKKGSRTPDQMLEFAEKKITNKIACKKRYRAKMTDLESKEKQRQRSRNYRKALRLTPEGLKLISDQSKKNYWKHLQYHRARKQVWYKANKERIAAKNKAKKIICI